MVKKALSKKPAVAGGVASVNRALDILRAFEPYPDGLSLAELGKRTNFYKSTILRLAKSLIHYGFLKRARDGRYQIGPQFLVLAITYQRSHNLGSEILPVMRDLANLSGEGMSFYVPSGNKRLCLFRVDSKHEVRDHIREGDILPLDKGSGGRVLCAFLNMKGDIYKSIRRDYFYASEGERDSETAGISAPVFGPGGSLLGVLTLAGPRSRVDATFMEKMRKPLLAAAALATGNSGGDARALQTAMDVAPRQHILRHKISRKMLGAALARR
jgi:DNA-binding IclR family transcriptional regulator